MPVLLDEQLPRRLAREIVGHDVSTVQREGWAGLTNGALLGAAAAREFEAFLTADQNLRFQNPIGAQSLGIVVLITRFNHLAAYRPKSAEIRDLARQTKPGQISLLQIP